MNGGIIVEPRPRAPSSTTVAGEHVLEHDVAAIVVPTPETPIGPDRADFVEIDENRGAQTAPDATRDVRTGNDMSPNALPGAPAHVLADEQQAIAIALAQPYDAARRDAIITKIDFGAGARGELRARICAQAWAIRRPLHVLCIPRIWSYCSRRSGSSSTVSRSTGRSRGCADDDRHHQGRPRARRPARYRRRRARRRRRRPARARARPERRSPLLRVYAPDLSRSYLVKRSPTRTLVVHVRWR